jgi:murein DD-endopeptidase MepM/ murein hydrolase activator NlpD
LLGAAAEPFSVVEGQLVQRRLGAVLALAPMLYAGIAALAVHPLELRVLAEDPMDMTEAELKGYDIKPTGLTPVYPKGYACSPLTSLYASWIDVDGTRRKEQHSGVDGGHLGDPVLAPASGTVRRAWVADWGWGHEGALLVIHTREDLNLTTGPDLYYAAFYHLKYSDVSALKEGQRIARGQRLASVFRPGGKRIYLPEVHFEVYEVGDDTKFFWGRMKVGTPYFDNPSAHLIDPLYMLSLEVRPTEDREVLIQPFEGGRNYDSFKGFTYFLPCRKRG